MLCTRHGYWIGSTEFGIDHQPTPVGRLLPELSDAQQRHKRLVHRHGWKLALHAIAASQNVCVDLRFYGPSPQHTIHDQRIKVLIPTAHALTGPRYIAAFYPEIIRLAEVFCAPAWRPTARAAIEQFAAPASPDTRRHTGERDAIASKIAHAVGYPLDAILANNGHLTTFWLAGMGYGPYYEPDKPSPTPARKPSTAPHDPASKIAKPPTSAKPSASSPRTTRSSPHGTFRHSTSARSEHPTSRHCLPRLQNQI